MGSAEPEDMMLLYPGWVFFCMEDAVHLHGALIRRKSVERNASQKRVFRV